MLTLTAETLARATTRIFRAAGTPDDIADFMAESLVDSNLAGHDSHGVIRIPTYVNQIERGDIVPAGRPEVTSEGPGVIQVDGSWGFGQYAASVSMDIAAKKAHERQVALVTTTRVNHIGRLGQWAEQAAHAGVVGLLGTSWSNGPFAATPYGGAGKVLSTNPIAFGIPLPEDPPFVLDYATTAVAEGKLQVARAKQAPVPDGWIVDRDGRPTNDVEDFYTRDGMLLPFGGHKGYALSLVVEILSVALTAGDAMNDPRGRKNGAFFLAIDPAAVRPLADFAKAAAEIDARVLGVPPAPGSNGVMIPGQPEARNREARRAEGIPVAEATWEAIQAAAKKVGTTVEA
ncbi:MAG: Ldh family oxidoreductase [Chloroflexi bacterium]|nr:Ldh family oxidoreductase [Chloroflexota bacterium]